MSTIELARSIIVKEVEIALKTDVAQKFQLVNSIRKWTKFHLNSYFIIDKSTTIYHQYPPPVR